MTTHLVALNPGELQEAQGGLVAWIDSRLGDIGPDIEEAAKALQAATEAGINTKALQRALVRLQKRKRYLGKLKAALQAGYLMIPNLPLDLIAVRTDQQNPRQETGSRWDQFTQSGRVLEQGTGRYVNPLPLRSSYVEKDAQGKDVRHYFPSSFDEVVDLPLEVARPEVIERTRAALAARLFDQIGVCRDWRDGVRGDPIVCGRILDSSNPGRAMTFFVAWTVDTRAL